MKQPQRVYNKDKPDSFWTTQIQHHNARVLKNGENPSDYPESVVAFESVNFGWILSQPDTNGKRHIILQY